jgi:DNA-binding LytR/AlgR family response regulator
MRMRVLIVDDEPLTRTGVASVCRQSDPEPAPQARSNGAGAPRERLYIGRRPAVAAPRRLTGEKGRRLFLIDVELVDYIESDGNYVSIRAGEDRYIARNTLKNLTAALAPSGFIRITRSLLINLHRVAYVERLGGGRFEFTLRSGKRLASTPTFRRNILEEVRQVEPLSQQARAAPPGL